MLIKLRNICLMATFTLPFTICTAQDKPSKPILIFQSGFEGSTKVVADSGTDDHGALYEHIAGIDSGLKQKRNWDKDWVGVLNDGYMGVQYTGGDASKRYAKVEVDPTNPKNNALHFWLNDAWPASEGQIKARVQTNIYGIKTGYKEFYQSVRVFLTEDFNALKTYPHRIPWCTISEFWNNEWWVKGEEHGFRVTLGVGKPTAESNELNFILNAENAGQKEVWNADNVAIKVPIGKWFTMDYYFKEGNKENGRFWMRITPDGGEPQNVFDVHNFTHATNDLSPNGLTSYNPMKLYTSKDVVGFIKAQNKTLQIYWDDFRLWSDKRP
ncbi:hypothetical protein [Parasediminibacterium sp. JCM 36343]|uniref:hypothetical protein n=1 Tax=Parasediminibacterium sp. JCM 36343 TaxID=3374279 RepID=UPI00397DD42E